MAVDFVAPAIELFGSAGTAETDLEGDVFVLRDHFQPVPASKTGLVQVGPFVDASTAVITVQGRMNDNHDWVDIIAFDDDSETYAAEVMIFPEMRGFLADNDDEDTIFVTLYI